MLRKILIISEGDNSLLDSIKEGLTGLAYEIHVLPLEMAAVNQFKEHIRCILIDANKNMIAQRRLLYLLRMRAVHDDVPIFAVCTSEELQALRAIIPPHFIYIIHRECTAQIMEDGAGDLSEEIDRLSEMFSVKKKILVVDDSGAMLRSVKNWLEPKYTVYLANSGAMAIKYLALRQPDLILLDYEMPVCDGRQFLEMIKTESEFADIPVIFLTRKGDPESITSVKHLRPERYLLKTLEPSRIIQAVDDFFEEKRNLTYALF